MNDDYDRNIETCRFVRLSQALDGLKKCEEVFMQHDHNTTWGDADRTLISRSRMNEMFDYMRDGTDEQTDAEILAAKTRIDDLPEDTYIDLEN